MSAVERRFPLVPIDGPTASALLRPFSGGATLHELELLAGGHVNTNYIATVGSARVVLRIFARGETIFRKEIALLQRLRGSLPVPRVLYASGATELLPHPYAVLEWIDGRPLNAVIASDAGAAREAGQEIAAVMLRMREETFPDCVTPSLIDSVRESLFERGAARWLARSSVERLWKLVELSAASIETMGSSLSLVHGDFQNDNLLLHRDEKRWRLAGVVDWEWAQSGSYLQDLGSLLRFDGAHAGAFQDAVAETHERNGAALPELWRRAASILDTAAQCEKLTHPTHRGEVTHRAVRLIERCLREYDG